MFMIFSFLEVTFCHVSRYLECDDVLENVCRNFSSGLESMCHKTFEQLPHVRPSSFHEISCCPAFDPDDPVYSDPLSLDVQVYPF